MNIRLLPIIWSALCATALGVGGCAATGGYAEPYPPEARREYRGMWVATVANIDWPSKPGLDAGAMRAEMVSVLDAASKLHLNAIFLQVRPSCDAIYPSDLEPWTEYLTGKQGDSPGFDPLAEWIEGAHARAIELHAWFNPFRARQASAKSAVAPTHVASTHPDWVKMAGKELWLDPGEPGAREHSLKVILDVVRRYDIDGVHFDDYFYPYPTKDVPFPDGDSYRRNSEAAGTPSLADWRRGNINAFVCRVYDEVHAIKPWVRVGISPFGIWRPNYPAGVKGFDAYDGLYADSLRWLAAGWVDYLAPQLYWKIDSPQPYAKLLDWWVACSIRTQRRPILAGNFTGKLGDKPEDAKAWQTPEILNQITLSRDRARLGAAGNIHFSATALTHNRAGIADALLQGPYAEPAIPPEMRWLEKGARPGSPRVDVPAESAQSVVVRFVGHAEQCGLRRWVVWARHGAAWTMSVASGGSGAGSSGHTTLARQSAAGDLDRVAVGELDAYGRIGPPTIVRIAPAAPERAQAAIVNP